MQNPRPVLPNAIARALFLARHGLADAPSGPGKGDDLHGVVADLGFVQVDSVNTLARAHDLILWARRQQYRTPQMPRLLADRRIFEHWTHDAALIDMAHFPHWRLKMARDAARISQRWNVDRRAGYMDKTDEVLRRIADQGGCTSADVGIGEARGSGGWWDWHPSKTALEYLWRAGDLSVTRRDGFRKVYDLTERVIPPEQLNARVDPAQTIDWACGAAMDRLGFATSGEIAAFWDIVTKPESKAWCADQLATGALIEIDVQAVDGSLRRSFARPQVMDESTPDIVPRIRVLSPFDPALRDRKRAERLFGFRYRIEIFVPAPQRRYGYYVFPVIEGATMIGRVDVKRDGDVMAVRAFWPEHGIKMGKGRTLRLCSEFSRLARFAGCDRIDYARDWLRA